MGYDPMAYKQSLTQSTGASDYIMGTPWHQCPPCLPTDSRRNPLGQGVAQCTSASLIDIDSELQGIARHNSRASCEKFQAGSTPCKTIAPIPDCPAADRSEDTRLSNPPCTLRSTGFNRWEWLCKDPQASVEVPFDFNVNSQLIAKDSHRPLLPTPVDPRPLLPPDEDAPIHASASMPACPQEKLANLPMVSWQACDMISRYQRGQDFKT